MSSQQIATEAVDVSIEQLQAGDLAEADRISRLAFGTFLGLADPATFDEGSEFIRARWSADPSATFAAKIEGKLAGTNFGTNWGSVGFFGPLTVHPEYWDRGIGKRLMEPMMDLFSRWGTTHTGLFTFAQSQKHVGLYQRFGFWPRFLTAIMSKPVRATDGSSAQLFSALSADERGAALKAANEMTGEIFDGLTVQSEIEAIADQKLGETVLLLADSRLVALGVCHCGAGTEAGPDTCYIKFGAARPGPQTAVNFAGLIAACETLAFQRGLSRLVAGVNTARIEAYQQMLAMDFRTDFQGVEMHRPNEFGYSRPGAFVIDDWR